MGIVAVVLSVLLIGNIMVEGFETLVLPRRIERRFRPTGLFYQTLWRIWKTAARRLDEERRDNFLAIFGPFSLLLLLTLWAVGLIVGFALFAWGLRLPIAAPEAEPSFDTYLYLSATTFITLGFGDVTPRSTFARVVTDLEAGLGFGFLAIVIGYFPVLYAAFSRREVEIALLDARASSPPSAGALLSRAASAPDRGDLRDMLRDYERWSAEILESHLSYPVLMFYRSQHDRQSWLGALTAILDTCAILIALLPEETTTWQARMTFAMSRHASVDLALVFDTPPRAPEKSRLPPDDFTQLRRILTEAGLPIRADAGAEARLQELRDLYEPYVYSLSQSLLLKLPAWLPNENLPDNWQTSAWDRNDHFFQMTPPRT